MNQFQMVRQLAEQSRKQKPELTKRELEIIALKADAMFSVGLRDHTPKYCNIYQGKYRK